MRTSWTIVSQDLAWEEVPYLDGSAQFPESVIPAGTDESTFVLDADGGAAATDVLSLIFGSSLGKTFSWNGLLDRFTLNDTLEITGNLIVSGTINGVPLGSRSALDTLSPFYPNSIFVEDGGDNLGSMHEQLDTIGSEERNAIRWETKQALLQDYDVVVRYTIPQDFVSFAASPISLEYETEGTVAQSKIDFTAEKDGTVGDQFSGAGLGLTSATWTEPNFVLGGTWVCW